MSKPATLSAVSAILNHDRAVTSWVCRAIIGTDGKPAIEKIARLVCVYPRDGAGRLRVALTSWHNGDVIHHVSTASGYGYDKLTAALAGGIVGGFTLGDHCDRGGHPTLRDLCHREGWQIIGSVNV